MADLANTLGFAFARGLTRVPFTTFNANLGAMCGPTVIHTLPASVHRTVVNSFKRKFKFETSPLWAVAGS